MNRRLSDRQNGPMLREDIQRAVRIALWLQKSPLVAAKITDPKVGCSNPIPSDQLTVYF